MNLLEMVMGAQGGDVVSQVANRFQLDEGQARSAMGALIPALSRGISRNASEPQGLDDLIGALANGNHSQYLEQPQKLGEPSTVDEGNGILGHVFGSKDVSRQVAAKASESTGIDSGILKQMLPVLASVAMGAMSKNGFGSAVGAGSVNQLAGGQDSGIGGMLASFLDADKDGSVIDDVLGMASKFLR